MNILSRIRGNVSLTLKAALQRRATVTAKKTSDLGSSLQKYTKALESLQDDADELKKEMARLKKVFVKAAKVSVRKQLEDSVATFKNTREKWAKAASLVVQIESDFGDNPAASKLLAQAKSLVKELSALNVEKEKMLSELTKSHVPVQLTTHDKDFFRPLIAFIVNDLKSLGTDADIKVKESKYIPGVTESGQIRWARYIPLVNVPTIFGETKNTYLVVTITFLASEEKRGKILPMMIVDKRGVEKPAISQFSIGMMNKFNDPIALSKILYKVASVNEAKDVLSYLAQKNNLAIFGHEIEGTVQSRLEKVKERLRILNDPDIEILKDKNKRNFITVKVPVSKVNSNLGSSGELPKTTNPTEWDKNLYLDVQAYAGLPKDSRYNAGRLRIEKVYKKGSFIYFLFRVLNITSDRLTTDDLATKELDRTGIDPEFDMDNGGQGSLSNTGLKNVVDNWLRMNNK